MMMMHSSTGQIQGRLEVRSAALQQQQQQSNLIRKVCMYVGRLLFKPPKKESKAPLERFNSCMVLR